MSATMAIWTLLTGILITGNIGVGIYFNSKFRGLNYGVSVFIFMTWLGLLLQGEI